MIMNIAYTRFQSLTFDSLQPIYINAICIHIFTTIVAMPYSKTKSNSMKWTREAIVNKQELSKESTVYHYRLLKRIHYSTILNLIYWGILVSMLAWELIHLRPYAMLLGIAFLPLLHALLIYLHITLKEKRPLTHWQFRFRLPWLGLAPTNHIGLKRFRGLQMQVFWVTIMIIGCFYPWAPLDMISLLFVHLWIFLPRLIILFRLRKHSTRGFIKLNDKDTSCYSQ